MGKRGCRWWNADSIIGKILRFVYESDGVSEMKLKEYINTLNTQNVKSHYDELIKKDREYNLIFVRTNTKTTKITKKAREYIQNM